jgi:hypothetical protein
MHGDLGLRLLDGQPCGHLALTLGRLLTLPGCLLTLILCRLLNLAARLRLARLLSLLPSLLILARLLALGRLLALRGLLLTLPRARHRLHEGLELGEDARAALLVTGLSQRTRAIDHQLDIGATLFGHVYLLQLLLHLVEPLCALTVLLSQCRAGGQSHHAGTSHQPRTN